MIDAGQRADDIIRTFYRTFVPLVGGRIVERDGVVACIGVHPSPIVVNTGWRADPAADARDAVHAIQAIYEEVGYAGAILTSSSADADVDVAAAEAGRHLAIELPVMVLERTASRLSDWPVPPGADVRKADPATDLDAFVSVLVRGFADADDDDEQAMIRASFATPNPIAEPGAAVFIGLRDDAPVSVAGVWLMGTAAAVGWVATLPDARRRGIGALVTARASAYAFDHGADVLALQASPLGRPVYERLGYRTVGLDRVWEAARD